MPDYTTYTSQELIEAQSQLSQQLGEEINGIFGGLPVASQNQEFFAVFDEAGSTGPEIIGKTQFRITYLVDSNLNTSKPTDNGDAAINASQNFEKSKYCVVRADNATVLNQNLTGKQSIYDIGSLQLISTTEYGKANDEYITTMSFNGVGSQLVGNAQNISAAFTQPPFTSPNQLTSDGSQKIIMDTSTSPISASQDGSFEWVDWDGDEFEFIQSTLAASTRIKAQLTFKLTIDNVFSGETVNIGINIYRDPVGGSENIQLLTGTSFVGQVPNQPLAPQDFSFNSSISFNYEDFSQGDKIYAEVIRTGGSTNAVVDFTTVSINFQQETPPGDTITVGFNAVTSSYWEGVTTISGSGISSTNYNQAYSILTASVDLSKFTNGTYIQRLSTGSEAFDAENDGNTFNPIQLPFQFLIGDEIRFEYNANKVHKVMRTEVSPDNKTLLYITPGVNTQTINVEGSLGTQLNHFTHYRIVQNGGYLFINEKKDNVAGIEQDFKGIITPLYPSEKIKEREDELIYELKQVGIIET
jgi:hypothetical protein